MSRSGNLPKLAADIETAHMTASHAAYRAHLERRRSLACDISLMLHEDAGESAAWLRDRQPAKGRVNWLSRLFLSLRLGSHGHNAADAILEAAKAVIRQAAVHDEYVAIEGTTSSDKDKTRSRTGSGRYRRGAA